MNLERLASGITVLETQIGEVVNVPPGRTVQAQEVSRKLANLGLKLAEMTLKVEQVLARDLNEDWGPFN